MIKTNILTLEIQDKQNESTISVELTNETMHKLYRIKELHKHNSLIEYKAYADFCDEIKAKLTAFVNSIDHEYLVLMDAVEQGKEENDIDDAIKELDKLILAGYDYKEASEIISKKYLKQEKN